ncbi:2-amino-4-hydroxy-6-hydroxymethyldihydropteridine diphosphokinase [Blattabacterium cuenoti]|uniref:2-amino-4-hydroxy-6- hydroxymethyldihydropteridine diphosphokinase n=1 Tax=Blattabacterium cuenoti TaxID=1653831 RepID=UPI00163BDBBA|nr:2-amino-4-hydroxy-6-hydroxymethyldihydropteridine diphosphokinase [Blattabacterium cuenoti]
MNNHSLFLSLSSNKKKYIKKSYYLISKLIGTIIIKSSLFESQLYIYIVIQINTELSPIQILKTILYIESILEKKQKISIQQPVLQLYNNKVIDIKILLYDNMILNSETIQIPHPLLHIKKFILIPMCEIQPLKYHPIFHRSVLELLGICTDTIIVKKI